MKDLRTEREEPKPQRGFAVIDAQEAIRELLLKEPGLHYNEILRRIKALLGCTGSIVHRAMCAMTDDNAFRKEKDGNKIRYFISEDDILPIIRKFFEASDLPLSDGIRMDPMRWSVKYLEAA